MVQHSDIDIEPSDVIVDSNYTARTGGGNKTVYFMPVLSNFYTPNVVPPKTLPQFNAIAAIDFNPSQASTYSSYYSFQNTPSGYCGLIPSGENAPWYCFCQIDPNFTYEIKRGNFKYKLLCSDVSGTTLNTTPITPAFLTCTYYRGRLCIGVSGQSNQYVFYDTWRAGYNSSHSGMTSLKIFKYPDQDDYDKSLHKNVLGYDTLPTPDQYIEFLHDKNTGIDYSDGTCFLITVQCNGTYYEDRPQQLGYIAAIALKKISNTTVSVLPMNQDFKNAIGYLSDKPIHVPFEEQKFCVGTSIQPYTVSLPLCHVFAYTGS